MFFKEFLFRKSQKLNALYITKENVMDSVNRLLDSNWLTISLFVTDDWENQGEARVEALTVRAMVSPEPRE